MEQQYPYTADRRSERHALHRHTRRPSSRGSSSHSVSSASDRTDDSRETHTLIEGSSSGRHLSLRDGRRNSPSPSGSPMRSESRHHRGIIRSPRMKSSSSVKKDSRSYHQDDKKHSGKRKHRDRSVSPDDDDDDRRRRRKQHKEREREKDKEMSREKEKMRKKDEERRSVLTGKKVCSNHIKYFFGSNILIM
jgi:hypothetical protein